MMSSISDEESRLSITVPPPTTSNICCYLLVSACSSRTYIGATVCIVRRVRQHNGNLAGGARATTNHRPWLLKATCIGFNSWKEALQFEWRWKHMSNSRRRRGIIKGVQKRVERAAELCASTRFSHISLEMHET